MASRIGGVASMNLKDIFPPGMDLVEAELERLKAAKVANDNRPRLTAPPSVLAVLQKDRFQVTWVDDVNKAKAKDEILKGVLGAGEFTLFVAKPGTAKSVLLCDMGLHIAAGKDWYGRKVKKGLVVFFAAERKPLTERRIDAWTKHHALSGFPFVVIGGKLDLTTGVIDAKLLAATIKNCEEKCGFKCVLVILDTVTRTFGAGDQHQSRDMQRYIQSVDLLHRATTAHVAAIHHSPWSDERGKGAIDLDGAVDASFGITVKGTGPTKVFTLAGIGANDDGDEGPIMSFKLDSVELCTDGDGNVTTAPVVVPVDMVKPFDVTKLKGNAAKALDALERAIEACGECPPDGSPGFPDAVVTVSRDEWRERYYADAKAIQPKTTDDTLKRSFNRGALDLTTGKKVKAVGERVWIAGQMG
jgi:AAA domain